MTANKTLKEKLREVKDYEEKALALSKEAINDIIEKLSQPIEMEGVKRISSSPNCVIVPISCVMENKFNLSACYYISKGQTEKLKEKIEKMTSLQDVFLFISKTLEDGYFYGSCSKTDKRFINPAVRKELEDIKEALS